MGVRDLLVTYRVFCYGISVGVCIASLGCSSTRNSDSKDQYRIENKQISSGYSRKDEWIQADGFGVFVETEDVKQLELAFATKCSSLRIVNTTIADMSRFSPLFTDELKQLEIYSPIATNLPNLAGCNLERLSVSGSELQDISGLEGAKVGQVRITYSRVQSLAPLRGTGVYSLDISGTAVTSLADITGEPIRFLHMGETEISDISPLETMCLISLQADSTNIKSLAPLRHSNLQYIYIDQTRVTDLTPLIGQPLKNISFDFWRIRDGWDAIMQCSTLETLNRKPAQEVIEYWRPRLTNKEL